MTELAVQTCTKVGRKPNPVRLDPVDEGLLHEIVECGYWADWQIRRAKVILGRADGTLIEELISTLGFSRASIGRTCRTYARDGIAGLMTQKTNKGGPRKYFEKENGMATGVGHECSSVSAPADSDAILDGSHAPQPVALN